MLKSWPIMADVNFYPRPPRGERPAVVLEDYEETKISIHALREESDAVMW